MSVMHGSRWAPVQCAAPLRSADALWRPKKDIIVGRAPMSVINSILLALLTYAFGAVISLLLLQQQVGDDAWLAALHLVGASVFFFLWLHQSSRGVKFQSFGAVLLLSCAVFRLINAFDTVINGARLE